VAFSQGQKTTLAALLGELFRGGHRFSSQGETLAANRTLVGSHGPRSLPPTLRWRLERVSKV